YQDYAKPEMIDYYERVLINHLLGAYEPERGMVAYITKLQPGGFKTYGTEYNSFWCCTGTGLESPTKFQKMIYTSDNRSLYVNLFIPSTLEWKAKGVTLRQTTKIPDEEQTSIELQMKKTQAFSLKIRHPY
ncbi:beta-L-arabinofuranosidase domain-containing protein, partial [Candidatus Symbiothrix dinenymphae]|uniref:beta-L-arabinofuranosidase domain-containing protein n=1 Tax=Candidatus Symbiothrix dinenymphae TaxID=467085 RepID=UPI000AC7A1F5